MFTNYWNSCATMLLRWQTRLCESTIKTFLVFLSVLILTDFFKVGICFFDSLSLPWVSTRMSFSPCLQSSRTTVVTSLRGGLSGPLTWIVISGLVTSLIWLLQLFRCRIFSWDPKYTLRCKDLQWVHLFLQPYVWWWSQSMNRFGIIPIANPFRIYIYMHYFWDTLTIVWLFSLLPPKIYLRSRFWSTHIFTKLRSFWKRNRTRNFWDFKLNLTHLSYVINHQDLSQVVLSPMSASPPAVDLLLGAPLSTEDLIHSRHRSTKDFIYWNDFIWAPASRKRTWTRLWSVSWNKRSENMLMSLLTFGFLRDAIWFWISYGFSVLAQLVV